MCTTKVVSDRIKYLRIEKNYSQQYLADKIGISQKAYSKMESGETKMSIDNLFKIAEILEIAVQKIIDIQNESGTSAHSKSHQEIAFGKSSTDKVHELYEKLLKSKDEEIAHLIRENEGLLRTIEFFAKKI